uniref:Uncharacterized protein n=1 Tax=Rhizophora mucronata TaxID=61149 RepID=A0A2P2J9F4_RHIMU
MSIRGTTPRYDVVYREGEII